MFDCVDELECPLGGFVLFGVEGLLLFPLGGFVSFGVEGLLFGFVLLLLFPLGGLVLLFTLILRVDCDKIRRYNDDKRKKNNGGLLWLGRRGFTREQQGPKGVSGRQPVTGG